MNVTFENPDKVSGRLTIVVDEADYKDDVKKELKDYRRKANIPGFRPGMAPMSMIERRIGPSVKLDVINKLLGDQLQKYITDNKIDMLGQPLAAEDQEAVDLEGPAPYTFKFDIALAPEFKIELSAKDKVDYYNIKIDDKLIDRQVEMFANQNGAYVKAEAYDSDKRDMLYGDLRELDDKGNTLEGGLTVERAALMPQYLKAEDQKLLFEGCKPGDIITFNPRKAYPDSDTSLASLLKIDKEQVANHTGDFSYQVTEVERFEPAAVDQKLFDRVFGEGSCKDEADFRTRISQGLKGQLQGDQDYKFLIDVRKYCEEKVGKLEFADKLLKKIMLENNKERGEEFVEKNYDESIRQLEWQLIKDQLLVANNIKIDDDDVRAAAREAVRAQFMQYGMNNVPDEYVNQMADEQLKKRENIDSYVNRATDLKLMAALKGVVKLNEKKISLDDFNKLMES